MPERAARELADVLAERGVAVQGVNGAREAAEVFSEAWTRRTDASSRVAMRQRLYRLDGLKAPGPPPEGAPRTAGVADREVLVEWSARSPGTPASTAR